MTVATQSIDIRPESALRDGPFFKLVGLAVVTIFPALAWMAVIAGTGHVAGYHFSATSLALTGAAISLFLAAVCAPLMLRTSN